MLNDGREHPAQSTAPAPPHWPRGVLPIGLEGLAELGVRGDGELYWMGHPVEVKRDFNLGWFERVALGITAASALSVGVESAVNLIARIGS